MAPQVRSLGDHWQKLKDLPNFIEKSMPALVLMQISDYVKDVFVGYEFNEKHKKSLDFSEDEGHKSSKKKKKKKIEAPQLPGGSLIASRIL